MDVLLLSGMLDSGGAPRVCHQVARHLPGDVNVTVAYLGGGDGLVELFEHDGIPVERLADRPLSFAAAQELNSHLSDREYDLVHTHMFSAGLIGRPIIKLHDLPLVHTLHTNFAMRPAKVKIPELLTAPFADVVVCVSDSVHQSLPTYYLPETEVVFNCIDAERVRDEAAVAWDDLDWTDELDNSSPIVANVARYDPKKRRIDLIDGFKHVTKSFPNAQLVLTGRRTERQRHLATRARGLGLRDNIHFLGFVENPQSVYRHADVIALPSEAEGFSIGMLEAMAHGKPIIATDIPAFVDALGSDYSGFVPVRSPRQLGSRLRRALSNRSYRNALQDVITDRIDRFSGEKAANDYYDIYLSCV